MVQKLCSFSFCKSNFVNCKELLRFRLFFCLSVTSSYNVAILYYTNGLLVKFYPIFWCDSLLYDKNWRSIWTLCNHIVIFWSQDHFLSSHEYIEPESKKNRNIFITPWPQNWSDFTCFKVLKFSFYQRNILIPSEGSENISVTLIII